MWSAPSSQPSCLIERKFFCIIWDYFRIYYKIFNIWVLRSLVSHSKGLFRKYIEKYVRNSQKNSSIFFFIQTIGGFSSEYLASSRWSSLIFSRNSLCRYKPQSANYSAALCHILSVSRTLEVCRDCHGGVVEAAALGVAAAITSTILSSDPFVFSKNLDAEHIAQTACPCHSLNDWDILILEAKRICQTIIRGCFL